MKSKTCKYISAAAVLAIAVIQFGCTYERQPMSNGLLKDYKGLPFNDAKHKGGPQEIPGKIQCEFYDVGGEGVAFHDSDSENSGSGGLNKANGTYLHGFRVNEAVDTSYTKFQDPPIDNSKYNTVDPEKNALYVGWTEPGEWVKYTVDVKKSGTYKLGLMYTANKDAAISLGLNDTLFAKNIAIPASAIASDPVGFRHWHHWNYLDSIATVKLKKGVQTFTIHTAQTGGMNYDYINFTLLK